MPLSKARNKERMRRLRGAIVQPSSHIVQPKLVVPEKPVQPNIEDRLRDAGLVLEGNKIVEKLPLYSRSVHKPGDRVLVSRYGKLIESTVPDADGNPIPE